MMTEAPGRRTAGGTTRGTEDAAAPRRFALALGGVTLLALALRLWGLPGQELLDDDRAVALSAVNFVERAHVGPTMWHHPRLRDLVVYGELALFGSAKLALTLASLVLGTLSVPLVGLVARRLGGSHLVALFAAGFLAVDALHVDFSRQAVHEDYMAFFALAAVWLALRHARTGRLRELLGAGVALGLGIASKWSVAWPGLVLLGWLGWRALRSPERRVGDRSAELAGLAAALVVLPLAVYAASFAPWFLGGHGLGDWLHLNLAMLRENLEHVGGDPSQLLLAHRAWLWFVKPVAWVDFAWRPPAMLILVAFTNPTVWLLGLPSIWLLVRDALRDRREEEWLLASLFLASYLPFVASPRPIFANSALNVAPFAFIAIARLVEAIARGLPRPRAALAGYALVVALTAAPLYLLAIGAGTDLPLLGDVVRSLRPPPELER